jgi:hypothetical protein
MFNLIHAKHYKDLAATGGPDYSVSGAISDVLFYIPGVSSALLCYLVFGTTKSWRQYRDMVVGGCSCGLSRRILKKRAAIEELGDTELNNFSSRRSSQEVLKGERTMRVRDRETSSPDGTDIQTYTPRYAGHPIISNKSWPACPPPTVTTTISITSKFADVSVQHYHQDR